MATSIPQAPSPAPLGSTCSTTLGDCPIGCESAAAEKSGEESPSPQSAGDGKPTSSSKPGNANVEQDPQSSSQPQAGDQQQRRYYRRLIRRKYMDPVEAANDPDLQDDTPDAVWHLKLYGPDQGRHSSRHAFWMDSC